MNIDVRWPWWNHTAWSLHDHVSDGGWSLLGYWILNICAGVNIGMFGYYSESTASIIASLSVTEKNEKMLKFSKVGCWDLIYLNTCIN